MIDALILVPRGDLTPPDDLPIWSQQVITPGQPTISDDVQLLSGRLSRSFLSAPVVRKPTPEERNAR